MFGIRFIRVEPTDYLIRFKNGRIVNEGRGLSFFYWAPTSSLARIPMASVGAPFIFEEVTSDFQQVTIQGQITYRIQDAKKIAEMLNFTIDPGTRRYLTDDPLKLNQRLIQVVQVLVRSALQHMSLAEAIKASDKLVEFVQGRCAKAAEVEALGLEILGLSILAVKPNPETARALEAQVREQILREMDEAIYARRNAAVEQERAIKENELNTEIAVENKKRQIRETQIEADRSVLIKRRAMEEEDLGRQIELEESRKEFVARQAENQRREAETRAYGIEASVKAMAAADPRLVQALVSVGMSPQRLIADAFRELAGGADKIGTLNITPDLLREIMDRPTETAPTKPKKS